MKQPLLNNFHWTKPHHIFSESRDRRISQTYPTPTLPALYIQYACKIWFFFFNDIASYKCRPDGYQSQITFNKTTWKRWNNPFWTISTEQNPITFSLSHVTGAFPRPTPPSPYTVSIHTIRVQNRTDFHDIAWYKCRPDGYQSQITFDKTTWKRWNNPFWTIFTEQNPITFSLSHVTGAFPRPTPPPPYPLYTYNTRARYDRFSWYSLI